MFSKVPIAGLQLQYHKGQTFAAILGIAFTTLLLFMQIGFRAGFLGSLVKLPASFNADIVLLNASSVTVLRPLKFSERRLYQTLAFEEVNSVTPIYYNSTLVRDPDNPYLFLRQIQVIGIPIKPKVIDLPGIDRNLENIKQQDSFLLDRNSRKEFSPLIQKLETQGAFYTEIRTPRDEFKKVKLTGLFELGASTSFNASMVTSEENFLRLFDRTPGQMNIGLVKLKPGADIDRTLAALKNYLPPDVKAISKETLILEEKVFYENSTPIGLMFRFGLIGSMLVGTIVLYQILYQKISGFIKDYATFKAIGFSNSALVSIVLKETLILAVLGYLPGFGLSIVMYDIIADSTGLSLVMKSDVAIAVLGATCAICFVSGSIFVWKLKEADPADIFG
ncbi:ABC transporter permease DevC [Baaleninema sp.]|uniref:ABC transporter permease DevC n=1 Tax=Baaleninema sp. TaxID=3101197 RepID=UPI003D056E7F